MSKDEVQVLAPAPVQAGMLTAFRTLPEMVQVAGYLADSTIVPKHYQGQQGNVLIALNTAQRRNLDPMMVMQNLYVVYGTPSWSGQFCIAAIKSAPQYRRIVFEFLNGKDWRGGMRVVGYRKDDPLDETPDYGPEVTPEIVAAEGWDKPKKLRDGSGTQQSRWVTNPELMYRYRSASEFARTCCPEVLMGLPTQDYVEDEQNAGREMRDVTPQQQEEETAVHVKPRRLVKRTQPQEQQPQPVEVQQVQEQEPQQVQPQVAEPQAEVELTADDKRVLDALRDGLKSSGVKGRDFFDWCRRRGLTVPKGDDQKGFADFARMFMSSTVVRDDARRELGLEVQG